MNKQDLVQEVAAQTGITKRVAGEIINAITDTVTDALARGEKVTLVGFGTFRVVSRKARTGRNPQTGASIQIPAREVPKFVPGKALAEKVS